MSLLADRILYKKNWGEPDAIAKDFDRINRELLADTARKVYSSKVITLDDQAATLAYELSLHLNPERVLDSLQYFRLPTNKLWIEFRRDAFLPETPKGTTAFLLEKISETAFSISLIDEEIRDRGNVMSGSLVKFFFSRDRNELRSMGNPLGLSFRQRTYFALGMQYQAGSDLDKIFEDIGLMVNQSPKDLMEQEQHPWRLLSEHIEFDIASIGPDKVPQGFAKFADQYLQELAGTIRHVLAILLLYYFPPVERYERQPQKGRRIINGKSRPFLGFDEVKIRIPNRKPTNPYKWVRSGLAKTDIGKRRHDVDGHWRKVRLLTMDELLALGKPVDQLEPRDFYKWAWVRDHQRGDINRGFVRKRRHLVAG